MTTNTEIKKWRNRLAGDAAGPLAVAAAADAEVAELRAALVSTAAELEEWRFTNRIDELQRENDRLRASQQCAGELPQDERWEPSEEQFKEWCERHNIPAHHGRDAFDDAASLYLTAQRAASVPAAGFTMEGGTVSGPYCAALESLQAALATTPPANVAQAAPQTTEKP